MGNKKDKKSKKKKQYGMQNDSWEYYRYAAVGGGLASGVTRLLATPADLAKCRMNANPQSYFNICQGISCSYRHGGVNNIYKGWAPTFLGHFLKGAVAYGTYDMFKNFYSDQLSTDSAYKYRTLLYLASAASAGLLASVVTTPFESMRIRMQSSACYPNMRNTYQTMRRCEGMGSFFRGLAPVMCRTIPFTMMQMAVYDRVTETLYKGGWVPKSREQCSLKEQLLVTFIAGTIAGMFASVVSQPFENVLNYFFMGPNNNVKCIMQAAGGITGLFWGWGPRFFLVGSLIGMKWLLYDAWRMYNEMPRPPPPDMPASLKKQQKKEEKVAKKAEKKRKK